MGWCGRRVRAAFRSPEQNHMIGRFWMRMALGSVGMALFQVETHANPADGPSRHDNKLMDQLGADFTKPKLPEWMVEFWCMPDIEGLMHKSEWDRTVLACAYMN